MIEIKITVDAALSLLLERMKHELKMRQRDGLIPKGIILENLNYSELISIVETSVFDTVFLLPIEIIRTENNLTRIVSDAVRALSKALHREEFQLYSPNQAMKIIFSIKKFIDSNSSVSNPGNN
jgi:hypothetical protein